MKKETKQVRQLEKMLNETKSKMKERVILEILDYSQDYEDITLKLEEIIKYGLVSGTIGSMIYYKDTTAFYEKHKEEINDLLYELCNNIGEHNLSKIFNNQVKWNEKDPLALDTYNQNLLAWFGYEETIREIYEELKGE